MEITPDGGELFLAMSNHGLWSMVTQTGSLQQVSNRIYAEWLSVDPLGKRLYVSYQGGTQKGHDSLEVFDIRTKRVVGTVQNPRLPVVGGCPAVSPDDKLLMWDGTDACESPAYDHAGCPEMPGRVVHFLRLPDLSVVKTHSLPVSREPARFIDSGNALLLGSHISVMNTATYRETEKWGHPTDFLSYQFFRSVAVDRVHSRAYVGVRRGKRILSLEADPLECAPTNTGLVSFYPGDGVPEDVIGGVTLNPRGDVSFGPGRVGQAFVLDGRSGYLEGPRTQHYRFGYRDSSVALYVKFGSLHGEMALLDSTSSDLAFQARLTKGPDQRLAFTFRNHTAEILQLASKTLVVADRWYHVCVTKNDRQVLLYLNGSLEAQKAVHTVANELPDSGGEIILHLGASKDHAGFLNGKLDEILFYNRALSAADVKHQYEIREAGGLCHF